MAVRLGSSCIVPQTAAITKIWIVRRKKPPATVVFSTLIQTGAGSKKIETVYWETMESPDPCELFSLLLPKQRILTSK